MRSRSLSALALLAVIAGCDSSDPVTPQLDVDATLTQMATGAISNYATAAAGVTGPAVPGTSTASCSFDASSQFFVCASVTTSGMTFSRKYQLLDATGASMPTANPLAVASIRSVIDVQGTMSQAAPVATTIQINRHEDATLSGIQSANRVLNGTATQQLTMTGSSTAISSNEASVTTDLKLPATRDQKYPLGGKIVTTGTATLSGITTSVQQYQRELSFDGTSVMTMKLTSGAITITCKIDLAAPGSAPSCT